MNIPVRSDPSLQGKSPVTTCIRMKTQGNLLNWRVACSSALGSCKYTNFTNRNCLAELLLLCWMWYQDYELFLTPTQGNPWGLLAGNGQKHLVLSAAILTSDSLLPVGRNQVQVPKPWGSWEPSNVWPTSSLNHGDSHYASLFSDNVMAIPNNRKNKWIRLVGLKSLHPVLVDNDRTHRENLFPRKKRIFEFWLVGEM